jgi:hypothetical protein
MAGTSTITVSGTVHTIYGSHQADIAGPPAYLSAVNYFNASLQMTAFRNASFGDQQKALIDATRMLDRQSWTSVPTDTATPQPLEFPRLDLTDKNGVTIADGDVPEDIVLGCYELADFLIAEGTSPSIQSSHDTGSNIKKTRTRDKVGDLETEAETEYFVPTQGRVSRFPTVVNELVALFLVGNNLDADLFGFASGTDLDSNFEGQNFDLVPPGLP